MFTSSNSKLYHGGYDADQIVDEQPALPAELVSDPAPYEAAAHPTDREDGDRDGVHEGRGLIGHVFPVIAESMRLSNKLLYHLRTSGIFTKFRVLTQNFHETKLFPQRRGG